MFYGPGQQPGLIARSSAGRGGLPFAPQQGMMLPGVSAGRAGPFAGLQPPQGNSSGIGNAQQVPPNAFGMPGQIPFGAIPQAAPGGFPNGMGYPQALAQVQALGRGSQGGRGQLQGMQGVQTLPPQMMGLPGMLGRDGRVQYPPQPPRSGLARNLGMQAGPMSGFLPQGRGPAIPPMVPQNVMGSVGVSAGPMSVDAVASAPPGQQKQLIGEALYPKIQLWQPELAGKITGMLLEMDNAELIGL